MVNEMIFTDLYRFYRKNEDLSKGEEAWKSMNFFYNKLKSKYEGNNFFLAMLEAEKEEIQERNNKVAILFDDIYNFYIKYANPSDEHVFWENLVKEASSLNEKYKEIPFINKLSEKMILAVVNEVERTFRSAS